MDLSRLAEFYRVAQTLDMKKAAESLGISTATLTARIKSFEKTLGVSLLERDGRGLRLTEAGSRLSPNAADILSSYHSLLRDLYAASQHRYRHLRIAVAGGGLPLYLGPFLDILNRNFPEMTLELLDDGQVSIQEGLRSESVDVYFASVMQEYQPEGIVRCPVAVSNQYVLLPKQHPLAGRNTISIRELEGECFILHPETEESCIRQFQMKNLEAAGIRFTVYEGKAAVSFAKMLVPIGKGLMLSPSLIMDLPPSTVCVSVSDLPHPATPCYFYKKDTENPEVLAFVRDYSSFVKEAQLHEH